MFKTKVQFLLGCTVYNLYKVGYTKRDRLESPKDPHRMDLYRIRLKRHEKGPGFLTLFLRIDLINYHRNLKRSYGCI